MKIKWLIYAGLPVLIIGYLVLAYIFMWSPVVVYKPRSPAQACVNNLREIDSAKAQFEMKHKKHVGDIVTVEDIKPYMRLDSHGEVRSCPAGGIYTIGSIGTLPTCSLGTNLPPRVRWGLRYWNWSNHRLNYTRSAGKTVGRHRAQSVAITWGSAAPATRSGVPWERSGTTRLPRP